MRVKRFVTWSEIFSLLREFEQGLSENSVIYGVPNGGMILTGFCKQRKVTSNPKEATVILDDILDSGKTLKFYKEKFPGIDFVTLFDSSRNPDIWLVFPWEADHPSGGERGLTIEQNLVRIIQFIGEDPDRSGLIGTPNRVIKSYKELFSGYEKGSEESLKKMLTVFEEDSYDQMVLLKDIDFFSICEHHMLPFYGKAHVAYIPNKQQKKVVGISKLARVVEVFARRLQIQERICEQVTEVLMKYLNPVGVACVIEASHMCMQMRGVDKQNSKMITSSLKGVFLTESSVRQEFMDLINRR